MGIQSISRELKSRITFPSLILDDFYIKEFEYSGSLLTKDEFEIGTAPAMRLKIKLIDDTGALKSYNFENKECNAEIGINTIIDGDTTYQNLETYTYQELESRYYDTMASKGYEYHSLGLFTVEKAVRVKDTITLECIDRMYKAEVPYVDNLTYPATVLQVFQRACSIAGLSIASTVFANADYLIPHLPVYENVSVRKILASVAELAGGYAIINKQGQLEITTLEKVITSADIDKDTYINLKFDEVAPAYIDKVVVKVGDQESIAGSGNHPYTILNNLLVQNPANVVSAIHSVLNGLNYSPVQMKWQGDWTLNFGDRVSIYDDEVIRYSYLFDRKITYRGGVREEFKAPNKSDLIKNSTGKGSLTLDVNQIKTEIKIISGEIDQVISDTEDNFTQINQDIDSISNRVGTAEGDINSLELTATGLTNRISNAEGDIFALETTAQGLALDVAAADGRALNAQATADAVTLNFNNQKIGGRNYFGKTTVPFYASGTGGSVFDHMSGQTPNGFSAYGMNVSNGTPGTVRIPGVITGNGKWVVSFKARANGPIWAAIDVNDTGNYAFSLTTEWQKFEFAFDISNHSGVYNFVDFYNLNWAYYYIDELKIEQGTKATDWTRAEDELMAASHVFDRNGYTIKDSNGSELMSLSKGVANEQNIGRVDNVENGYPMKMPFHIGSEVSQITQAILKWDLSKFRTYSKGAASGGGTKTTPSGGAGTTGTRWGATGIAVGTSGTTASTGLPHNHTVSLDDLSHSHSTPSHTHSLDITHEHAPVFGILETDITDNWFYIYIDGELRGTVGTLRGEIDLSAWITTSGWHIIELHSATLKRIDANLFLKTYIRR